LLSSLKAFIFAPLAFLIILGAIFAYSGIWPPMVVIESKSMQHGDDSAIGVIDTGDIVIVKKVTSTDDVVTYLEAIATGHSTYGELGDVVIYYKSGMSKPIIHRAMCDLVYNSSGGGFDVPDLANVPPGMWSVSGPDQVWWNLQGMLELQNVGYVGITLIIDLASMLDYMTSSSFVGSPHGGLITMGDNNWYESSNGTLLGKYDQKYINTVKEPIKAEWLIGKARAELPWFGLLKLYVSGTAPSYTPRNSQVNLAICLGLIIIVPIILDIIGTILRKRGGDPKGWIRRMMGRSKKRDPPT
jgi:signal peptidase